jgi:Fe2+ or Zn2+ uptake regulation protein
LIEGQREFLAVRDRAIRRLYPDRFNWLPEFFVCAECGKTEVATDRSIKDADSPLAERWTFQIADGFFSSSLGGCCEEHWKKVADRLKSHN